MTTVNETAKTLAANLLATIAVARRSADLDRTVAALEITDRASYLVFVSLWKERLHGLVADIRAFKASCKGPGDHSLDQSRRQACRVEARAMMLVRRATKAKAAAARRPLAA